MPMTFTRSGQKSAVDLIPAWYLVVMAMTLRLSDDETEALRERAALEHRSMQEVAREAISSYISDRSKRLRLAIQTVATEDAELLDRLSK